MGCATRKPFFWVSIKVRLKPACIATETSYKIEHSPVAVLDIMLSNKCEPGLPPCIHLLPKTGFLVSWPSYCCNMTEILLKWMNNPDTISDSFTILGLWVLGLAVSHINESNCKLMSPEHSFFMPSLQYYCILGLAEMKTLHPRDKIMLKRCRMPR